MSAVRVLSFGESQMDSVGEATPRTTQNRTREEQIGFLMYPVTDQL